MRFFSILLITILLPAPITAQSYEPADMIIWGGPIYTADDENPEVEAIAIKNGIIIKTGTQADIATNQGPETNVIDLMGHAAFPGFTDSHAHVEAIGTQARSLDLTDVSSIPALQSTLREWVQQNPEEMVVTGSGWLETHWPEKRFPSRWDLDSSGVNKPVILMRADHHAAVVNSLALKILGIDRGTSSPEGGDIVKNTLGEPTGILIDNAMAMTSRLIPKPTPAQIEADILRGSSIMSQNGWTAVHNMAVDYQTVSLMETLSDNGLIKVRLYNSIQQKDAEQLFISGKRINQNSQVITRAIKLFMDGALGSRGAALAEPYADADTEGLIIADQETIKQVLASALQANIQINTHAIGDKANHILLNWYEDAFNIYGADRHSHRWRIEHAQIINIEDMGRLNALGVIASMQPSHAIGDLHFAPDRLGAERLENAYRWQSLLDAGVIIAGGSDAPVEEGNPLIEFYAAIARRDLNGFQGENWNPREAVDRETALKMFTLWPAIASFQENDLGSLTVGKKADISIFDVNLMTAPEADIIHGKATMTIIDGEVAYSAADTTKN